MKVLHLCHAFLGSKVHVNLYTALFDLSVKQVVYYPLRPSSTVHYRKDADNIESIPGFQLKKYHRIFFRNKIKGIYRDLSTKVDFKDFDLIHATTLFGDGAVAYRAFKEHGIPYLVAVRQTDTDLFLKFRPDLFVLAKSILLNAQNIIFISDALRNNFFKHPFINSFKADLIQKSKIIYNGIDPFWMENRIKTPKIIPNKILYVGIFDNNKNVMRLIRAFLILKKDYPEIELNIVGSTGAQYESIKRISCKKDNGVNYLGPVYEKEDLLKIYRANHIFAMASIRETFGLVYMEALSQGLPLVFTKSQGLDGIFKEQIGEAISAYSVNSIKNGLKEILNNYEQYNTKVDFSDFYWSYIAKKYQAIYEEILLRNSR